MDGNEEFRMDEGEHGFQVFLGSVAGNVDACVVAGDDVCAETHEQVKQMCAKLNELLAEQQTGIVLDFEWIEKNLTGGSIRERHLAKALRMKAYETFGEENQETLTAFFTKLFGGKPLKSKLSNVYPARPVMMSSMSRG